MIWKRKKKDVHEVVPTLSFEKGFLLRRQHVWYVRCFVCRSILEGPFMDIEDAKDWTERNYGVTF